MYIIHSLVVVHISYFIYLKSAYYILALSTSHKNRITKYLDRDYHSPTRFLHTTSMIFLSSTKWDRSTSLASWPTEYREGVRTFDWYIAYSYAYKLKIYLRSFCDFWPLGLWTSSRLLSFQAFGHSDFWTSGLFNFWDRTFGLLGFWTLGLLGFFAFGFLGFWISSLSGFWDLGLLGSWAFGLLGLQAFVFMGFQASVLETNTEILV